MTASVLSSASPRGHRVRELVVAYRSLRNSDGRVVDVPAVALNNPRNAAAVLGPLVADQAVEVFGVACLSTKHRLLTWHVLSRGTRDSTPVSLPDVFLPACLTPGATGVMVVHNHPSGDPTPSPDDARLTLRLCAAADVLDLPLLDHLIVGDEHRYFSFHESGLMGATPVSRSHHMPPLRPTDSVEVLDRVKASLAALAAGAALTRPPHFTRRHLSKRRGISKKENTND